MSEQQALRFGVCGLGFMGRTHFSNLHQNPRARIVAVCDLDEEKRAGNWPDVVGNVSARGGEHGSLDDVAQHIDYRDLIANPEVDVVLITLPTHMHADVAITAVAAGKHVLCEKPMGLSVESCDAAIYAAESAGRTLMIGQCIRFWPQYELIKELVDTGRLGKVHFAQLRRVSTPPSFGTGDWFMDHMKSGGALLDLHVHDVDFAHHLLGTPAEVQATGMIGCSGGLDHVSAHWRYPDGRYVLIEGGWVFNTPFPFNMSITVHGEKGTVVWDMQAGPEVRLYRGGNDPEILQAAEGDGWSRELDYFIDCVLTGVTVNRCPPVESRDAVALALIEREAAKTGQPRPVNNLRNPVKT